MAGNYPDAPGVKFQYDRDGSIGGQIQQDATIIQYTNAQLIALNNESADAITVGTTLFQSPGRRPFIISQNFVIFLGIIWLWLWTVSQQ